MLEQLQRINTIGAKNQFVNTTTCETYEDFESQYSKSMMIVDCLNDGMENLAEMKKRNS